MRSGGSWGAVFEPGKGVGSAWGISSKGQQNYCEPSLSSLDGSFRVGPTKPTIEIADLFIYSHLLVF